jgi:hypothetical protein
MIARDSASSSICGAYRDADVDERAETASEPPVIVDNVISLTERRPKSASAHPLTLMAAAARERAAEAHEEAERLRRWCDRADTGLRRRPSKGRDDV